MSLTLRKRSDSGMKRSNYLPASNSIFKSKGVVEFFPRNNSPDSESSSSLEYINFSIGRKKDSALETTDGEERRTKEVSKIHLHPKARFSTKPHVLEPETWKQRFLRVLRSITRRMRRCFRNSYRR
ncbi:hypothetical protein CDAR_7111 [Caerostris darwini]|uniref:Uncharacterized protein n=1 Tax=Caerostris darwini TaxID=1538125 RepID=A0AAV4VBU4_9ARAC|nr:hypothetical protein CDAR_7111 [Caerostris darwini]